MQMANTQEKRKLLKPEELVKIQDLFLLARNVVEGFVTGLHHSPYKGFSLEFAEHRKYVPGDEIKHIDWKLFARTRKYYVKQFESDTNMRVYLCLDVSRSMDYGASGQLTKLNYSSLLASALCYLISKQDDLYGLITLHETLETFIPAKNSLSHMRYVMDRLGQLKTSNKTSLSRSLNLITEKVKKRALFVLFTDFFDDLDSVFKSLARFKHSHHEVIVFHVLDNDELLFPFKTMSVFQDMETNANLLVDPVALRKEYLKALEKFKKEIKVRLSKLNIDYVPVNTLFPFEHILANYLHLREKHR